MAHNHTFMCVTICAITQKYSQSDRKKRWFKIFQQRKNNPSNMSGHTQTFVNVCNLTDDELKKWTRKKLNDASGAQSVRIQRMKKNTIIMARVELKRRRGDTLE